MELHATNQAGPPYSGSRCRRLADRPTADARLAMRSGEIDAIWTPRGLQVSRGGESLADQRETKTKPGLERFADREMNRVAVFRACIVEAKIDALGR